MLRGAELHAHRTREVNACLMSLSGFRMCRAHQNKNMPLPHGAGHRSVNFSHGQNCQLWPLFNILQGPRMQQPLQEHTIPKKGFRENLPTTARSIISRPWSVHEVVRKWLQFNRIVKIYDTTGVPRLQENRTP